ncbi:Xanthine and CO dehydrogenases maturation factor, XdhC/CoxF family [Desulfovibrio sp. DV]|uniref:XdhC family protein n=1 Tax=Desulfovibrio sp. DV TaxID=1844708 RepID=UPI00094BBA18|nr:XdhC/CoxI family protein [Desulfovibrio sp. DV]OLN30714.1 Xanthine and CO dehydrogenases maturation factor, XdhC/CoxF family [Desulfovibrio sp. DV]
MRGLIDSLNDYLGRGESVVAAAVVSKDGSAPGPAGARMLLFENADIAGTVGGGPLEGRTIQAAVETMASGQAQVLEMDLSGEIGDGADAICGGVVQVFLERIDPTPENVTLFQKMAAMQGANQTCLLVSSLAGRAAGGGGRGLFSGDGRLLAGALPETVVREAGRLGQNRFSPSLVVLDAAQYFLEPLPAADPVYICGAGHIARPTCQIAALADFKTIVLDDRAEFASPDRFPWANEVAVLPSFDACFAGRSLDAASSVVIVSRCHKQDRKILIQALGTDAGYIGMIGSSRKVAAVLEELVGEGFSRQSLARTHAPIGLPIGGDTPAEIAVSIVAELIKVRTGRRARSAG